MNLTLSLLAGLTLLLPGLSALAAWNFKGAAEGAAGPEVPLTSVNGLFMVIGISAILHLAGYWITYLVWSAIPAFSVYFPFSTLPLAPQPYQTLWSIVAGSGRHPSGSGAAPTIEAVAELGLIILAECVLAVRVAASRLLDVVLDGRDMRSLGWVYQNIFRPRRNGYQPFAYVLTSPAHGDFGLGYQGMIADIRMSPDGQLKSICLSEPEAFVYELKGTKTEAGTRFVKGTESRLKLHKRRWLNGVVALEASVIRNVVVHHIPEFVIDELDNLTDEANSK